MLLNFDHAEMSCHRFTLDLGAKLMSWLIGAPKTKARFCITCQIRASRNKTAMKINKQPMLNPVFTESITVVCLQSFPDPPCTGH